MWSFSISTAVLGLHCTNCLDATASLLYAQWLCRFWFLQTHCTTTQLYSRPDDGTSFRFFAGKPDVVIRLILSSRQLTWKLSLWKSYFYFTNLTHKVTNIVKQKKRRKIRRQSLAVRNSKLVNKSVQTRMTETPGLFI